jgi:hypothetical protein
MLTLKAMINCLINTNLRIKYRRNTAINYSQCYALLKLWKN